MNWEERTVPGDYPDKIKMDVGLIALRYGHIDRLIVHALEKRIPNADRAALIGIFRNGRFTLGNWIKWIASEKVSRKYNLSDDWLNELKDRLEELKILRNGIFHDALLQNAQGDFVWMSGDKSEIREHRLFNFSDLTKTLEKIEEFTNFIIN